MTRRKARIPALSRNCDLCPLPDGGSQVDRRALSAKNFFARKEGGAWLDPTRTA